MILSQLKGKGWGEGGGEVYLQNEWICTVTGTGCNVTFNTLSSYFCQIFISNSILLCDSKAKACFTVDELLLKISQQSIPVEAQGWWKFSTGKAALWPSVSSILVCFGKFLCQHLSMWVFYVCNVMQVCSAPDLFWLSSATSLNDTSPKNFDIFWYFFLPVIPCCHSLFWDVSKFPLDLKCVFR